MKDFIIIVLASFIIIATVVGSTKADNLHAALAKAGVEAPQVSATIKVFCRADGTANIAVDPKP